MGRTNHVPLVCLSACYCCLAVTGVSPPLPTSSTENRRGVLDMSSLYLRGPSLRYSAPGCFNKSDLYALVTYAKTRGGHLIFFSWFAIDSSITFFLVFDFDTSRFLEICRFANSINRCFWQVTKIDCYLGSQIDNKSILSLST